MCALLSEVSVQPNLLTWRYLANPKSCSLLQAKGISIRGWTLIIKVPELCSKWHILLSLSPGKCALNTGADKQLVLFINRCVLLDTGFLLTSSVGPPAPFLWTVPSCSLNMCWILFRFHPVHVCVMSGNPLCMYMSTNRKKSIYKYHLQIEFANVLRVHIAFGSADQVDPALQMWYILANVCSPFSFLCIWIAGLSGWVKSTKNCKIALSALCAQLLKRPKALARVFWQT